MATSGTTTFNPDILELIEEAYEMVGVEMRNGYDLRTARRSLDMLMREWANRGINFWTLKEASVAVSAGTSQVVMPADVIDVLDVLWRTGTGTGQNDRQMTRVGINQWAQTANKNMQGVPSQYWVNRTAPPAINLWPVPSVNGTLLYYKIRSIEDTGAYSNTMDIPSRFIPAMVAGLAYQIGVKTPAAATRLPILKQEYDRQFMYAEEEDRERASLFLRGA